MTTIIAIVLILFFMPFFVYVLFGMMKAIYAPADAVKNTKITNKQFMGVVYVFVAIAVVISLFHQI